MVSPARSYLLAVDFNLLPMKSTSQRKSILFFQLRMLTIVIIKRIITDDHQPVAGLVRSTCWLTLAVNVTQYHPVYSVGVH